MHINCPDCTTEVLSENMDLPSAIAKCHSCNNIFEFTEALKNAGLPARLESQTIPVPPGIEIIEWDQEMEINVNWRKTSKNFTLIFALLWNTFILPIFFYFMFTGVDPIATAFLSIFALVGVYLIYASISYLVNTTNIFIDKNLLAIEHRPINFLIQKDKYVEPKDIDQLFVQKYSQGSQNDQPVYAYRLKVLLKNKEEIILLKNMHSHHIAKFIESEVEYFLGIKDFRIHQENEVGGDEMG